MDSSGSQEKKPIPRFASFKPPPPPEADRPLERPRRDTTDREDKSRSRTEHHSRHRNHRDRSRSRERRRTHRDIGHHSRSDKADRHDRPASDHPRTSTADRRGTKDDASDLYVIDLKGDKYNLIYGTLHRYSVPEYYRVGRGNVLGLPSSYRIDRESVVEDKLVIRNETQKKGPSRTKAKSLFSKLSKQQPRLLRFKPQSLLDAAADFSKDYLPLSTSESRKHRGASDDPDTDNDKYAYRSIHGKAKPEDHLPSDVEATSNSEVDGEDGIRGDPDEEIKQKNVLLSRGVEKNPADVGLWLEYIDHQESLLRGSANETKALTYAEKQSLADIKLSLYEKALKKVGQSEFKDRLLLGFLEEGTKLWDTKKISSQWQAILRSNSQYISLWVKYLDFRQTEFLNFTYQQCLDTYIECLKLNQSAPETPGKSQIQLYLFLRLTLFMREAGFAEHAAALWQAILEVVFFRPDSLGESPDVKEVMSSFLEFWESEVARVGDVAAKGWKSGSKDLPAQQEFKPVSQLEPKALILSWVSCERERTMHARLPAFSLNESDQDDPYRVILASDLEDILTLICQIASPRLLLDSFLFFCRLPPMIRDDNQGTLGRWAGDPFVRNEIMSTSFSTVDDWIPRTSAADEYTALPPFLFPQQSFVSTIDNLFSESERWFSSLDTWKKATSNSESDVVPVWTRRALRLLVDANPGNDNLAEHALAVEFACSGKDAKKFAKSLLKKRSSSLRLYNAYALMEWRSDNQAAAQHVWATALSMSRTFSDHDKMDSILLWQTWLWELLETRNMAQASYILLCIPQNNIDPNTLPQTQAQDSAQPIFTATSLLKIQSHLSELQERVLAHRKATNFVASTDCLAILSYLTNAQDLLKALEAYTHAFNILSSLPAHSTPFQSYTTEILHQSRAKLLYHHIHTRRVYKPSHIRALLSESIALFPHNTIFLSLFAWTESRFRIDDRVRTVVRDITTTTAFRNKPHRDDDPYNLSKPPIPITTHLFSIYTELNRPIFAGSTAHSVRAAFEEAIGDSINQNNLHHSSSSMTATSSSSAVRSNPSTWKLYILFELSRHEIHRAKDVFYRGMRACPWSKELIMLAFTHLRADVVRERYPAESRRGDGMDFDELRHVYNVLVEKELRIHVDIEQELDDLAAKMMVERKDLGLSGGVSGVIRMPDDGDDSEVEEMPA
ncbi:uncharacterized protein BO97DRAFT_473704 [Aspergillus homomorphus CBS 101889]|uniref:DUF1740-domain-containing protein n=1 Tax=Aspergillus homomorphus (strain CBS 101889) TaxID=1450537 RepID=A0A395HHN7_ASPHC|nr:DUF1740-domain-containing protein [Aspergillus homomorphus CBS 101889]RAL07401.1 DUF1740-domain-containing protein [Aspergillus homomorphus CBS 101889]